MRAILVSLLLLAGPPALAGETVDALLDAMARADTLAVAKQVEEHYRQAGISTNETLVWETQAFDEIVNWYNDFTETIRLSSLPDRSQSPAYWDNWSRVLTASRWDWRKFFTDDEEAYRLAGFNQFLLAAHEYGHALTYRYDPEHESRGDHAINCREYPADRLAAALLQELSRSDARMEQLRQRYRQLIDAIQAEIDPDIRLTLPSFAALDADCRILHVEQPRDEASMVQYASAFFARQSLLLATDLPPLAELYATHLLPRWRERQHPNSGRAGAVTTGPLLPEAAPRHADLARHLTLGADGEVYVLDARLEGWPLEIELRFGPLAGPLEPAMPRQRLALGTVPGFGLAIGDVLALGPDRVLAVTYALSDEKVWLIDLQRGPSGWRRAFRQVARGESSFPRFALDTAGGVHLFLREQIPGESLPNRLRHLRLTPGPALAIADLGLEDVDGSAPAAILPDGSHLVSQDAALLLRREDGSLATFAGGLQGFKDAPEPTEAEFAAYEPDLLPAPDGSLRLLDFDPRHGRFVLRHIAAAP